MKRGITAVSAAILILIIILLVGTVSIASYNILQNSKKIIFAIEIANVQEEVTKYHMDDVEGNYPTDNTTYVLNLSNITASSLEQFSEETIVDNQITLYEINLSIIGIDDARYGNKESAKDIYVVSKDTGIVYYIDGVKAGSKTYYTLTDDLIALKNRREKAETNTIYTSLSVTSDGFFVNKYDNGKRDVYLSNVKVNGNEIKIAKYETDIIPISSAPEYFKSNGSTIQGDRIKVPNRTFMTLYIENKNGDHIVRYVGYGGNILETDPTTLHSIYTDSENNTAPIPAGFVVSKATGETKISEGLVIYEGTTDVTDDNVASSMASRDQYVWIPVDDITSFVRRDGYLRGTVQTFVSDSSASEPYNGLSASSDSTGEYVEYTDMYNSVAKYGGFYIARYEAGSETERASATSTRLVPSQKDKYQYNYVSWGSSMTNATGGAVELARSVYQSNSNKGAISTLIYGVEWDATIKFLSDVQNTTITPNNLYIIDSANMGWYSNNYSSGNLKHKTGIDVDGDKSNKVKNIYDMAGNILEWTMEAYSIDKRVCRGGYYLNSISSTQSNPASIRGYAYPVGANEYNGFRIAIYMK